MGTPVKKWERGSIAIAVERGKDHMCHEDTHVHIYKRGRRTDSRIPGGNADLDRKDYETAEKLYRENYREIVKYCDEVKHGVYGD